MSDDTNNVTSSINSTNKFKKPAEYVAELESKTNAQLLDELAALDLEQKKQEIEYRKLDMAIKKDTWTKIQAEYAAKIEDFRRKNEATLQFLAQRASREANCNHRKGGRGADAVMRGQGDDSMYSVVKHKLPAGSHFVLCQRCGKEWHPANKWNIEGGKIVPIPATPGWAEAMQWPTDNSMSASSTFLFEKVEVA
jgi:hypothetical protein